ncbi:MAG: tetratricopeptide repeat protein [Candidatus Sungbacteria bacterium]|nr:tetratricopeptide repeat protein [Candidatus Sungbacteria bacterium]
MMNEQNQQFPVRFANLGRTLLFIFAGAVPLWFLPWRINVDFGREMTFLLLIIGAFVLWLLSGLLMGKFRFVSSSGLYAGALFLLAALVSTFLSKMPFASAFLNDPSAEKWSTLLAGFVLMVVTANLLVSRKDVSRALLIFLLAAGAEAALTFFSLAFNASAFRMIAPFIQGTDFNVIGTINSAALLYATAMVMAIGFVLAPAFHQLRTWVRWAVYAAIFFFAANLLMVHFRTAWIILFIGSLFLSAFMFWMSQRNREDIDADGSDMAKTSLGWKYALSLIVLAFSLVMLMVPGPIVGKIALPTEVSPSAMTTLHIARSVYREGVVRTLFGSGPATFSRDWMRYKDASINNTPFWGTQFNQGYSLITTLAVTLGIMGVVLFLLFLFGFLVVSLRALLSLPEGAGFMAGAFLGFVGMICVAALYPANLTFVLLLFFFAGLLMTGLASRREVDSGFSESEGSQSSSSRRSTWLWSISERWGAFQQPWAVFAFSLAIVLLLSLSIGMLYYQITRIQSAFAQVSGLTAVNKGNLDGAIASFERAAGYEKSNPRLYQALVQLRTEKIRSLIAAAAQGKNVQNDFQQILQLAIQNSQSALALSPEDPLIWQTQGALYELIIPYIPGADRLAFGSYQKEMELDPLNPTGRIDLGRAGLAAADRIQIVLNQQQQKPEQGVDVAELTKARTQILEQVEKVLQEAVGMKADFAAAHFLLAQTALRAGNMQKAIQSTENTKLAAPFDIGVAFQLGLLYYQNNNLEQSATEFERAVSMNPQYSNARYFLGLIRSRQGNVAAAITQFEEIAKVNPDNQEIKQILENLHSGRSALDNIAPPATPPEQRSEPPVEEGQKSSSSGPVPQAAPKARGKR